MTDLLKQGAEWLEEKRAALLSSPVTYRRGDQEAMFAATFGRTDYEVEDDTGVRVTGHVADFLVAAEDFVPVFGTPEPGDRIAAEGAIFEVMSLAGQVHWRWSDPYRSTLRIHTREIGAEP